MDVSNRIVLLEYELNCHQFFQYFDYASNWLRLWGMEATLI